MQEQPQLQYASLFKSSTWTRPNTTLDSQVHGCLAAVLVLRAAWSSSKFELRHPGSDKLCAGIGKISAKIQGLSCNRHVSCSQRLGALFAAKTSCYKLADLFQACLACLLGLTHLRNSLSNAFQKGIHCFHFRGICT